MLKKILAGLTAAILSLGVVALVAGPASAHHNTVSVKVTCSQASGYTVTWSVTNSEAGKTESIVESSNPAVVPVGTAFAFSETKTFTQTVSDAQDLSLTVKGFWADGNVYNTASASVSKGQFPTGCIQVTPKVSKVISACTGPNQYNDPTYTLYGDPGIVWTVNGNVTPAGTYPVTNGTRIVAVATASDPKYTLVGQTSWDYTFKAPDATCTVIIEPVAPTFEQQICTAPGEHALARYFIPTVTGVLYSVKIDGVEQAATPGWNDIAEGVKTVQVIARGDTANYYVIDGGSKVYDVFTVNPAGKCLTEVLPVTPTVVDATCDVVNAPGVVPASTYTLTYVEHVVYQVSTNGGAPVDVVITANSSLADRTFTVPSGTVIQVTARADDPTKYQTKAFTFDHTFADPGDCKAKVTPIAPTATQQFCDDSDPVNPVTVPGQIEIFAAAGVTYYIDGVEAPAGVYDATAGDHTITVSYDTTKYTLDDAVTVPFVVTVGGSPCIPTHPLVTPATTSSQISCFADGSFTLKNDLVDPAAVIWTVNGSTVAEGTYPVTSTGTVTVTAAPNAPTYGFAAGAQTSWTINFKKPSVCDLETLALTGQSPVGLLVVADFLVVGGLSMFGLRALRRNRSKLMVD